MTKETEFENPADWFRTAVSIACGRFTTAGCTFGIGEGTAAVDEAVALFDSLYPANNIMA